MTGCTDSGLTLLRRELDETIERFLPAVESLLQTLAPDEAVEHESEGAGYVMAVPLRFPDGVGHGKVVAELFRYRDQVRLDIELVHNRMFALPDGSASDRRCFMNDFVASQHLTASTEELSPDFRRSVVSGVHAALDAVQRHNRAQAAPWSQVTVVGK